MGHITYPRTASSNYFINARRAETLLAELTAQFSSASLENIISLLNGINLNLLPPNLRARVLALLAQYQRRLDDQFLKSKQEADDAFNSEYRDSRGEIDYFRFADDLYLTKSYDTLSYASPLLFHQVSLFHREHAELRASVLADNSPQNVAGILNDSGQFHFKKVFTYSPNLADKDEQRHEAQGEDVQTRGSIYVDREFGLTIDDIKVWQGDIIAKIAGRKKAVATKKERALAREEIETKMDRLLSGVTQKDFDIIVKSWIEDTQVLGGKDARLDTEDGCRQILEEAKLVSGGYGNLKDQFKGLTKAGYEADHILPITLFLLDGEKRSDSNAQLLPNMGEYTHDSAFTLFLFDGQTPGEEHRIASNGQRAFARSLNGKQATLELWIDASVKWNAEVLESRFMYQDGVSDPKGLSTDRKAQAHNGAIAIRNLMKAHFKALGCELSQPLGNGVLGPGHRYNPNAETYKEAL